MHDFSLGIYNFPKVIFMSICQMELCDPPLMMFNRCIYDWRPSIMHARCLCYGILHQACKAWRLLVEISILGINEISHQFIYIDRIFDLHAECDNLVHAFFTKFDSLEILIHNTHCAMLFQLYYIHCLGGFHIIIMWFQRRPRGSIISYRIQSKARVLWHCEVF